MKRLSSGAVWRQAWRLVHAGQVSRRSLSVRGKLRAFPRGGSDHKTGNRVLVVSGEIGYREKPFVGLDRSVKISLVAQDATESPGDTGTVR